MRLKVKWVNGWARLHGTGPDGKRIRRALKTQDPRRAEEIRAQIEADLWKANLYGPQEVVTFAECALAYAEDGGEVRFIVKMTEQLGTMKLRDITPKAIRDAARRAYPRASNATLNRQGVTPARAVMNFGHEQGWCGAVRVRSFPVEKPRRKAVGREYLELLRPHLPDRLFALMLYLHQTGRRVGDAIELPPEARDGTIVEVAKTKTGRPITVKITDELADMLDSIEPRHRRLFGYIGRSSVYNTLRRACGKAGVEYLGTHQPGRHSFATELHEAGFSDKAIAEAGGWATTRMVTDVYQHPKGSSEKAADHFSKEATGKKLTRKGATHRKI
ncbi:tyrosine-type recombinase/integrase [Rhodovulum sulfidophilum]|uniref:tyrosine-type recombinase/integrase n=1 Tax=Rhodovulum sulfidophilum TaxID=35806 RepID=UPI0019252A50|nr:tyrosine-type recombinase/integrase [Rhodovulum sulfidophilum]